MNIAYIDIMNSLNIFLFCVAVFYTMKYLFIDYCKSCNMRSFIGDEHCCKCKRNFPRCYADENFVQYYKHCCDCKEVYDDDEVHMCKKKID